MKKLAAVLAVTLVTGCTTYQPAPEPSEWDTVGAAHPCTETYVSKVEENISIYGFGVPLTILLAIQAPIAGVAMGVAVGYDIKRISDTQDLVDNCVAFKHYKAEQNTTDTDADYEAFKAWQKSNSN